MNRARNMRIMLAVFILLFALLAGYLFYIIDAYGDYWFASPYNTRVSSQRSAVTAGDIRDRRGVLLASSDAQGARTYTADEEMRLATAHIVGDGYGQTIGAQSLFAKYLLGFDAGIAARLETLFSKEKRRGDDIALTVDAELTKYAYSLLAENRGTVMLMNYKTGEVLAMANSPSFDLEAMAGYADGSYVPVDGSFVNRAAMGRYTPGSTFKIVTVVAALRYLPNATSRVFKCEGCIAFENSSGERVDVSVAVDADGNVREGYSALRDYGNEIHGELTLKEAFAHSCNNIFAGIALELGADKLMKTAESLGLNGEYIFSELVAYCGEYDKPNNDYELAWSGVGQYKDIMTPVNTLMLVCAAANGGDAMTPRLLMKVGDGSRASTGAEVYKQLLSAGEAAFLCECMELTVTEGTGARAALEGFTVCGKTGTAEVSSNDAVKPHAWFAGFIDSAEYPYAICVVIENAGTGGSVAAPVASKILNRAIELNQS